MYETKKLPTKFFFSISAQQDKTSVIILLRRNDGTQVYAICNCE